MFDHAQQSEARAASVESHEAPPSALGRFAEDVAGAIISPGRTLRSVGDREAIVPAIMLVLLITLITSGGQAATLLLTLGGFAGFDTGIAGPAAGTIAAAQMMGILWNFVWAPMMWTIVAGLLYGAAYLLGGRGRFMALWAATGFALAPQLLFAPLASGHEVLGALGTGWMLLGWLVVVPVTFITLIWTLILLAIAIRETMDLSTGRAFGSVALLIGGIILLGILLVCALALVIFAIAAAVAA